MMIVRALPQRFFPSIWMGEFRSKVEFDRSLFQLAPAFSVYDWIDDRVLFSRHRFTYPAYCSACEQVTQMQIDWLWGGCSSTSSSVNPAWTETCICQKCGLNSRMRALIDFLRVRCNLKNIKNAFIAEQVTPLYQVLKRIIPSVIGSEYLGPGHKSGKRVFNWRYLQYIRHEDLTNLSFPDCQFDLVITLDVFEHIPNYRTAFAEIYRILRLGGLLVFTIPFFYEQETTRIRAVFNSDGTINHLLPPEIHGNPISGRGSLCFQNFGWDILDELRKIGFADACAALYWGPWQGHLGYPFFVFYAIKPKTVQRG
jgi:SAM-dependent methyltransferase